MAFIPGLLMLATFGLDRLEASLTRDTVSATDVDEFLQQAGVDDVKPPARNGAVPTRNGTQRRLQDHEWAMETLPTRPVESGLPSPVYVQHRPNPQFQATQHANRV